MVDKRRGELRVTGVVSIRDLLAQLRDGALDRRDQGDRFERLIRAYLTTDPEWTARFDDVWLWSDWPGRQGRPDTGIDLVAKNRDDGKYTAIQCKFYDEGASVSKAAIDSFVASSGRAEFTGRYIFDTAASWSSNATAALRGLAVPVQRVDIGYLDNALVDWSAYSWEQPEELTETRGNQLRPHQQIALDRVQEGLADHDRGRLVMACGTGKTFTALKIAERMAGAGGQVLFLVPSIQLLSQSLREWMAQSDIEIRPVAVCSDVRVGRRSQSDDPDLMSTVDLTEPATTDPQKLRGRLAHPKDERMTVVFATYQSIQVVIDAQHHGAPNFDLVICDEAHRTTGLLAAGTEQSAFVKVHDANQLKAHRRLYMTATPRVFGEDVKRKASDADVVLADMNDEALFGPELHRLGFGDAVEAGLLTDYKVVVLAVDQKYVAENFQTAMAQGGEIALDDAARLIGCWNALAKRFVDHQDGDLQPMRRAVAFAKSIKASKAATASLPDLVDRALEDVDEDDGQAALRVQARHVDGTMGISDRNAHLAWLKDEPPTDTCRILTNARCLSEGVDVPALDAVLFLTPRGSQVDVVQSVGRVMRRAPGKNLGYIVLPVVIPEGMSPEESLRDNATYRVVWQVLQALRSHDDRFQATVNQIELNKKRPDRIIGGIVGGDGDGDGDGNGNGDGEGGEGENGEGGGGEQLVLPYPVDGFRDAMYARIVQKVGERRYWETWAADVATIAQTHITRITALLADEQSEQALEFDRFLQGLRGNLNESVTREEAVEMLAQHLITRPIFEALFADYDFTAHNPVAQAMERMLAALDDHALDSELQTLEGFYAQVRRRVEGVDNAAGKQRILTELYDKFFATAFRRTVDKLGIVYTPVEIVDFLLRSADDVLRREFGHGITDEGVHVLDGFTGTGTFIVRLLQSGLIEPHDLARKYAQELHANEILLLAYYIAAVNIETTYQDAAGQPEAFQGLVLTDTFQSYEDGDRPDLAIFPANNERIARQTKLPITVIVGNPPYSSGQDSANDDNQNESYPTLDRSIRDTYAARSVAKRKGSLYDSYIRAIRWATLRVRDRGVIALVTNGGWIDANSADGMRKTLVDEFSAIHVYNLRGNQRTAGEQSRREGGKVFDSGSRATVAIVVLVKDPDAPPCTTVHYTDIGDYLTRDQKLRQVAEAGAITALDAERITPNEHGDWLNQRRDDFDQHIPLAGDGQAIFEIGSGGLKTNRDAWNYNASRSKLERNLSETLAFYNEQVDVAKAGGKVSLDPTKISWDAVPLRDVERGVRYEFRPGAVTMGAYRPFVRRWCYPDREWNNRVYRLPELFPTPRTENHGFVVPNPGSSAPPFSCLAVSDLPDMAWAGISAITMAARWRYESTENAGQLDLGARSGPVIDGYQRVDNITDAALEHFAAAAPAGRDLTKDDVYFYVYGLLHSPGYRTTYAADLKRTLPRIPVVKDLFGFVDAGRALSALHLGYETVDPYPLDGLDTEPDGDPFDFYAVSQMRFGKPTAEQKAAGERKDTSSIVYNDRIVLRGIPEDAHRYVLGSRTALEWLLDRYRVKTHKESGIVNDPNDWSHEHDQPRYILDLVARIVTVSVETMKIVDRLPALDIISPPAQT